MRTVMGFAKDDGAWDVAIVGGGVVGCALALELGLRGARVVVLERSSPGSEASGAAAGMLAAQAEGAEHRLPSLDTLVTARKAYGPWVSDLESRTGLTVGYRVTGILRAAFTQDEALAAREAVASQQQQGLRAQWLDGAEARRLEPDLSEAALAAAYFPDDGQVEPPRLMAALIAALALVGVEVRSNVTVRSLLLEGDACRGVVHDGGTVRARATVVAAGSWSSSIPGLPRSAPAVRPARGQMVQLHQGAARLRTIVFSPYAYAVPRGDGRVVCGSTLEFAGYEKKNTAEGIRKILDGALRAVPSLGAAQLASTWSGLRPCGEAPLPTVGASEVPGLFFSTGHHRNGILMARHSALALAELIAPA